MPAGCPTATQRRCTTDVETTAKAILLAANGCSRLPIAGNSGNNAQAQSTSDCDAVLETLDPCCSLGAFTVQALHAVFQIVQVDGFCQVGFLARSFRTLVGGTETLEECGDLAQGAGALRSRRCWTAHGSRTGCWGWTGNTRTVADCHCRHDEFLFRFAFTASQLLRRTIRIAFPH